YSGSGKWITNFFMPFSPMIHIPVLAQEVLDGLAPKRGGVYVDGTLGGGGHTELFARAAGPEGMVLAMDRDLGAIDVAEESFQKKRRLGDELATIRFAHANFRDFPDALRMLHLEKVDGFLLDIGLSSDQLADRERGFSFDSDGPLDLRFDTTEGFPAYVWLEKWNEERIADIIYEYGEEKFSRRVAGKIVQCRREGQPIRTARELSELVRKCVPRERKTNLRSVPIDPATRTFQALRIAVNDELGSLTAFLKRVTPFLNPGGRVAIISFHSLEDRIVKNAFRDDPLLEPVTKKPITATDEEIARNPRSRSAKLRIAEKRLVTD
ncbi:MAG: 16S rRNA (cytosine(1402)-N(4))-methyltransferase RsmH, partial [Planctomycetaceae bacterium]|nr:16S rRNA (cytosine(1402)-N(4))-methyltransferase RsmH [Planctomycetaceae bacterium]